MKAAELTDKHTRFDAEKYIGTLILAGANILSPSGFTEELLKDHLVQGGEADNPATYPIMNMHRCIT